MDASSTGQGPGLGPILPSCTGLLLVAAAFINQGVIGRVSELIAFSLVDGWTIRCVAWVNVIAQRATE